MLAIVLIFVLSGVAFSSKINVKIRPSFGEIKTNGTLTLTVSQKSKEMLAHTSTTTKDVFAFAVEWLFSLNNSFKLGAGLEYVYTTRFYDDYDDDRTRTILYLPIYCTMQVNPVSLTKGAFLLKVILGMRGFF